MTRGFAEQPSRVLRNRRWDMGKGMQNGDVIGHGRPGLSTQESTEESTVPLRSASPAGALAALVSKPRVNLTRFHGVFAPHSTHRSQVTPAGRGKRTPDEAKTPAQRRAAMTWAQRLKRVFKIDIETLKQCGGGVLKIHR